MPASFFWDANERSGIRKSRTGIRKSRTGIRKSRTGIRKRGTGIRKDVIYDKVVACRDF